MNIKKITTHGRTFDGMRYGIRYKSKVTSTTYDLSQLITDYNDK